MMSDQTFLAAEAKMVTVSRRFVDLLRARGPDLDLKDIAHGLSNICRYTGQTWRFYSVGEHVLIVERILRKKLGKRWTPQLGLQALMHDASEAFINDLIRPMKRLPGFERYREIEADLEQRISEAHGIEFPWDDVVKEADVACYIGEKFRFFGGKKPDYPTPGWLQPFRWWIRFLFKRRYRQLQRMIQRNS